MLTAELCDVGLFGAMPQYGDLSVHVVIDLRRSFSRAELERAVEAAITAFPVLGHCYEPHFWRDRWVPVSTPVSEAVRIVSHPGDLEADTRAWVRRPIRGTSERPVRVVSLARPEGIRLILSLLHVAVDGAGVGAVGNVIGASLYGTTPSLPTDQRRDIWAVLERLHWYHAPLVVRDLAATLALPLRVLKAGPRKASYPKGPSGHLSFRRLVISAPELEAIKARCHAQGATVNDVLVAALARVGAARSSTGPVPVIYTMDLRRYAASPRLFAANLSSILAVLVPRKAVGDLSTTAGAVARITVKQRRGFEGPAFVFTVMAMAGLLPHGAIRGTIPALVRLPLDRGLAVTNVGRLDEGLKAFGSDIEDIRVIGPNIKGSPVPLVVVFGFRGALHIEIVGAPEVAVAALEQYEHDLRSALELSATQR